MADARNKPIWRVLRVTQPAAGAEFSITPNTSAHWLLWNIRYLLTTDGTAANRHTTLVLNDGSGEYARLAAGSQQAASLAITYAAPAVGQASVTSGTQGHIKFPQDGLFIPQGHTLSSLTINIQAGDQYSEIAGMLIEFPTGPREFMWPLRYPIIEESS